jgi:RNA polymerase sigma-70 factor (ECF subfamily)
MIHRPHGDGWSDRIAGLYDRLGGSLYRYALMILADPSGAADAVQQVFVAVLGRRGVELEFEERYLRRAVRNECYSALGRRRGDFVTGAEESLLEAVPASRDRPEERLALEQAIRELPAKQREVLHLKVYEGLTFQEIADQSGESINTVASRYRYAIEKLRAQLGARVSQG